MEAPLLKANFNSFTDMLAKLPDDEACRRYLEQVLWEGKPTCPHCQSTKSYSLNTKGEFKGMYKCGDCRMRYTVLLNTMFQGSHIPLRKWFIAIYVFSLHKKGISSHQLASDLGVTQKTAWFMLHRIRVAFKSQKTIELNSNQVVEIDETYVGGKSTNKHIKQRKELKEGTGYVSKTPVVAMLVRDGEVTTTSFPDKDSVTGEDLKPLIREKVATDAIIITDGFGGYHGLSREYRSHEVVNHTRNEYVRGKFHTNNVEGFFSQMKRGIYGIYHHCSRKHLQAYSTEFAFRYNVRKLSVMDKFEYPLLHSKLLTYKQLIKK